MQDVGHTGPTQQHHQAMQDVGYTRPAQQHHDVLQDLGHTESTQAPQFSQVEVTNDILSPHESSRRPSQTSSSPEFGMAANRTSTCQVWSNETANYNYRESAPTFGEHSTISGELARQGSPRVSGKPSRSIHEPNNTSPS
jgi:hypothetical protein